MLPCQNAEGYFEQLDLLIKYANERMDDTGVHVMYSTPSCYVKAINDEQLTWPNKTDDFFPYASSRIIKQMFFYPAGSQLYIFLQENTPTGPATLPPGQDSNIMRDSQTHCSRYK